jgi:hypothetical protein
MSPSNLDCAMWRGGADGRSSKLDLVLDDYTIV